MSHIYYSRYPIPTPPKPSSNFSELINQYTPQLVGGGIALIATIGGVVAYNKFNKLPIGYTGAGSNAGGGGTNVYAAPQMNRQVFPGKIDGENNGTGVLIHYQCPRGRKIPCIGPYPLKLETFLRVHGIGYEVDFDTLVSPKTDGPWITLNFEDIVDSQNCIKYLCEKLEISPDEHLEEEEQSISQAYNHLCENHLYWGIALHRWIYDKDPNSIKKIQYLTPEVEADIPKVRDTLTRAAWYHGIGKLSQKEVENAVTKDLESLSKLLGSKKFMLSDDKPSELDCTAFGMLAQILWTMEDTSFHYYMTKTFPNLQTFCIRIRQEYWADWDQCLLNSPVGADGV